jgi:hypothetical protein
MQAHNIIFRLTPTLETAAQQRKIFSIGKWLLEKITHSLCAQKELNFDADMYSTRETLFCCCRKLSSLYDTFDDLSWLEGILI